MPIRHTLLLILVMALLLAVCGVARGEDGFAVRVVAPGMTDSTRADVARTARADILSLEKFYDYHFTGPVLVYVAGSEAEFEREAPADVPLWAAGVAERRKIVISPKSFQGNAAQFDATLRHELSHVVLGRLFGAHPRALPRWLDEGLAVRVSEGWEMEENWADRKSSLAGALREGDLPEFDTLSTGFPNSELLAQLAYAQCYDFVTWLEKRMGHERMMKWLHAAAASGRTAGAYRDVTGRELSGEMAAWKSGASESMLVSAARVAVSRSNDFIWVFLALLVVFAFVQIRIRRARMWRPQYVDEDGKSHPGRRIRRPKEEPSEDDDDAPWNDEYDM